MKLYFSPGACSQAPNIAFREAELDFELAKVDLGSKRLESGEDYRAIRRGRFQPWRWMTDRC